VRIALGENSRMALNTVRQHKLRSVLPLELPSWVGSLRLSGLRAFDRTWDVRVEEGIIRVDANE